MSYARQKIEAVLLDTTPEDFEDFEELILFKAKALYHGADHITLAGKFDKGVSMAVEKAGRFVIAVLERNRDFIVSGDIIERSFTPTQIDFAFENATYDHSFGRVWDLTPNFDFR